MNEGHLLRLLGLGLGFQQGLPFGGQFLAVGIDQGGGLGWELCRRRSPGLRNLYIHMFNITGVLQL